MRNYGFSKWRNFTVLNAYDEEAKWLGEHLQLSFVTILYH